MNRKASKKPTVARAICVIIPAYNESAAISGVIRSVPKEIPVGSDTFKTTVVVVDDGSKDNTHTAARKAGARVLRHVINCGAGAATRTGLVYASQQDNFDYVVTIDADGQHKTSDIKELLRFAMQTDADMVVGNRLHTGNKASMPYHRRLGNWGLSMISRILFGIKIQDTQSGLRLFKASALPAVSDYTIDRYGFCTEMLWYALRAELDVRETPISVTYSAETLAKGQSNWGAIGLILDLLWIRIAL